MQTQFLRFSKFSGHKHIFGDCLIQVIYKKSTENLAKEYKMCVLGFMLGRYAADRTITNKNANIRLVHDKVVLLYGRFSHTFQGVRGECSCNQTAIRMNCNFTEDGDTIDEYSSLDILNILIDCFGSWWKNLFCGLLKSWLWYNVKWCFCNKFVLMFIYFLCFQVELFKI